jgi:D-3-phosphoglycerate dehydrogenase
MKKILVSPSSFGECGSEPIELLQNAGFEIVSNPYGRKLTESETIELGNEIIGVVAGVETYNRDILDQLTELKCISRVGVGIDSIDLEYVKEKNIELCITPNGPTQAVAELSLSLTLNILRRVSVSDRRIRKGIWKKETGNLILGKKVGLIGLGRIGKRTALLYKALGCSIIAYDKYADTKWMDDNGVSNETFENVITNADIISIHVPGLDNGKPLFNESELNKLKPGVIIINLSRGGVIDEKALFIHLKNNPETFAALDVFVEEPYKGELTELENILLTPHMGSYAKEAKLTMEVDAVNNLIEFFQKHQ